MGIWLENQGLNDGCHCIMSAHHDVAEQWYAEIEDLRQKYQLMVVIETMHEKIFHVRSKHFLPAKG